MNRVASLAAVVALVGTGWAGTGLAGTAAAASPAAAESREQLPTAEGPGRPPADWTTAAESPVELPAAGVTAAGYGRPDCADFPPESPGAGRDGWVFQAPGRFRSLQLTFADGTGADTTVGLPVGAGSEQGRFFDNGTEAWVSTPAGWTLRAGSATLAGGGGSVRLIRTCWGQTPTAARAKIDSRASGAEQKIVVVIDPTAATTSPPGRRPHAGGPTGRLPKTGPAVSVLVAIAVGLIVVGAALRRVRKID